MNRVVMCLQNLILMSREQFHVFLLIKQVFVCKSNLLLFLWDANVVLVSFNKCSLVLIVETDIQLTPI